MIYLLVIGCSLLSASIGFLLAMLYMAHKDKSICEKCRRETIAWQRMWREEPRIIYEQVERIQ